MKFMERVEAIWWCKLCKYLGEYCSQNTESQKVKVLKTNKKVLCVRETVFEEMICKNFQNGRNRDSWLTAQTKKENSALSHVTFAMLSCSAMSGSLQPQGL